MELLSSLYNFLWQVHYKFELMDETLFLTVNIIDRFLSRQTVIRKKLQLVGVTAMLLACKYEEVSVPVVEDLILISDRAYTRHEVLEMVITLKTYICISRKTLYVLHMIYNFLVYRVHRLKFLLHFFANISNVHIRVCLCAMKSRVYGPEFYKQT